MTPDPATSSELINLLTSLGPNGLLVLAIIYFKRLSDKREAERDTQIAKQETRITELEAKQESHAQDYREFAERLMEVVSQNKDVMQQFLTKLDK